MNRSAFDRFVLGIVIAVVVGAVALVSAAIEQMKR